MFENQPGTGGGAYSMNIVEAINKTNAELNSAMIAFDRWASQNPTKLNPLNDEFRSMKQLIKLLRLQLKEQKEMRDAYEGTLKLDAFAALQAEDQSPVAFTKSRNTTEVLLRPGIRLGTRLGNKISRG